MDRTNWQFGHRDINFLVIAIVVGSVSIPIVWKVLPKKNKRGNSNASQRIALTQSLLKLIPSVEIEALTMDREFIGKQCLRWLDEQGVGYVVRIKKNVVVGQYQAGELACRRGKKPVGEQDIFGLKLFNFNGAIADLVVLQRSIGTSELQANVDYFTNAFFVPR